MSYLEENTVNEAGRPDPDGSGGIGPWAEALVAVAGETMVVTDEQFRIIHWSSQAEAVIGWPRARAEGFGIGSVLSLSSASVQRIRDAAEGPGIPGDVLLPARRLGGERCPLLATIRPVPGPHGGLRGYVLILRPPAQVPSPEAGFSMASVLDAIAFPIALTDGLGTIRVANGMARTLFALQVGQHCCATFCGPGGNNCRSRRALRTRSPLYWELAAQGQRFEMSAIPLPAGVAGEPSHVLFVGITPQHHVSPELRKFFRAVDENLAGVLITDRDGIVEYANPRVSEILKYSPLELVNRDVRSFSGNRGDLSLRLQKPSLEEGVMETVVVCRDGTMRPVRVAISDIRSDDGEVSNWVVLLDDLSEHRELQANERDLREQLAHSARLAAVGEIASMIAHEINQPLTTIGNFSRGMLRRLGQGTADQSELKDNLEEIVRQVSRAGEIVGNVRNIARRQAINSPILDVNTAIREAEPMYRLLAKASDVTIRMDLCEGAPMVAGDRVQIEQVLVNLVKNAVEVSESLPPPVRIVSIQTRIADGGGLEIGVTDAAPLPDAATLERLGEPFFTTKPEGLGLGLSISRTLLENHGAHLDIRPLAEGGKVFCFTLSPPP